MSVTDFLVPISEDAQPKERDAFGRQLALHTDKHVPDLEGLKMAFFFVEEDRKSEFNKGAADGASQIRAALYALSAFEENPAMADLGNLKAGASTSDTYAAVKNICEELIKSDVIPIVLGGSQDVTYGQYLGYENMERTINLVTIDSRLDFESDGDEITSDNYLNKIVLHKPNYLFNYSNIGQQRYLVSPVLIDLMDKMYFDLHRLGEVNADLESTEPVLRNADMVSIDMSAVRASDCAGSLRAGPNGVYAESMCQMCRYAGMSDKLSSFGIYEYNPKGDPSGHGAELVAQMIWLFAEGVQLRKSDYPMTPLEEYQKYIVNFSDDKYAINFYKSHKSDRWWMEVPFPAGIRNKYHRHHVVPCSYTDYQLATNEELPDLWWKTYQKLT